LIGLGDMDEFIHDGYVLLARKAIDSQVFQNESLWKVFTWCFMKANHTPTWVPVKTGAGSTEVFVDRGQFIFGRKTAAKELRMKPSSVRNRMEKLKNMRNVDIKVGVHFSIVTICNYVSYQNSSNYERTGTGQAQDRQGTGTGQPEDTNKNDKNVKNDKNTNPPTPLQSRRAGLKSMEKQLAQNAADQEIGDNDTQSAMDCFLDKTGKSLPTSKDMQAAQASVKCHGLQWVKDAIAKIDSVYFGVIVNEAEKQDRNNNGKSNRTYELPGNENDTILKTL